MKNLSKVLSLVLALAMVLGVFCIGASAAFTDAEDINYDEAVEVLAAIKVLEGFQAGDFQPAGDVTRAQAAAIIARILLGRDLADALVTETAPFEDVPATNWAAGEIAYCVQEGIIAGMGDGTFAPAAPVTSYQLAKMLLVAVGFDADENGLTGANWQLNTARLAVQNGIFAGNLGADYTKNATREEASLYAFNALNYTEGGATTAYVVKDGDGKVIYEGTDALTALVMKQADAKNTLELDTVSTGSIGDVVYGLKKNETEDDFGRATITWTGDNKVEVVVDTAPVLTYAGVATTEGKLAAALGCTKTTDKVEITVITDGVAATAKEITKVDATTPVAVGATGALTEVYKTGDKKYDVVVINTYVHQLAKDEIVAAKAATATTDAVPAYITIDGMNYETAAFVKDDVVLYTTAKGEIQNVVKADYVSGAITATAAGYVRVDGVKYVESAKSEADAALLALGTKVNTYYLDSYGNIIFAVEGKAAEVQVNYVYVLNVAAKAAKSEAGDLFAAGSTTAAAAQAQVMDLKTGAISIVNQAVVLGTDGKTYYYANTNGSASATEVKDIAAADAFTPAIYEYVTLADGSIVLGAAATLSEVTLAKNAAEIGVTGKYANSATVVSVVETTANQAGAIVSGKVTTYTGIANFPALTKVNALVTADTTGLVSSIVIVKAAETATTVNYAVYAGVGESELVNGKTETKHTFYVGGKPVEYYSDLSLTEKAVYDITVEAGKVTKADSVTTVDGKKVEAIDATFIKVGGSIVYLADTVTVYDATADYALAELAVEDEINYHVDANGKIDLVVIVK